MIPADSLLQLRHRLDRLPPKSPERADQVAAVAELYGVSTTTVYRALRTFQKPRAAQRADHGKPRILPATELERYCEVIAALKLRTRNKQGRHLSTRRAIELLERYGVETAQGLVRAPSGLLHKTTVDLYLRRWHLDQPRLIRQPPAVRFQAESSNACWQFDLSPSDLKQVEAPLWIEPARGRPTLMLFSVVDDRSGVSYQEYRCVYGEDAESALRFLFNAMAPKPFLPEFPFQGIPGMLYLDNGPVAKSRVFQNVMGALGVVCQTHLPAGQAGRRVTARAKGKVERPFRTVKEMHETLYHFHRPQNEAEANLWLQRYLLNYNRQPHRSEGHSRLEDWLAHLPAEGFRALCSWDLSPGKKIRVPTRTEDRERELQKLVKKSKRPVALFIDDAHALKDDTLTGLKRLMEVVEGDGGCLSVVLAGWPKLRNDLRRPKLEAIGMRTDTFSLDGITGSQREYLQWLLSTCAAHPQGADGIIRPEAVDLLASRLRTPLQIEWHLTQALEAAYQTGESPIGPELVEALLYRHLDDLESTLTRQGYGLKDLVQNFDAKPAEIKALFANQLDPIRASDLRDRMRLAGLPI